MADIATRIENAKRKVSKATVTPVIISVLKEHGIVKASLFGSFATGTNNDQSDIDLLIQFKAGKTLLDLVGLKLDLEARLQRTVDVLTYKSIHPLLKESILNSQEMLYEAA